MVFGDEAARSLDEGLDDLEGPGADRDRHTAHAQFTAAEIYLALAGHIDRQPVLRRQNMPH